MARHTIFLESLAPGASRVEVEGPEADHARKVKRLEMGQTVTLLNGRGLVATAKVQEARRALVLDITEEFHAERDRPAVEVWSATPKGPRSGDLIDGLAQVGAASWRSMDSARSVVDPGGNKLARLERIAHEACKQSLRPWALELAPPSTFAEATKAAPGIRLIVADPSGDPFRPNGAERVRLLVGPEGGFTPQELDKAREAGAALCWFGPHVMRIEVAAPAACAVIVNAERAAMSPASRA